MKTNSSSSWERTKKNLRVFSIIGIALWIVAITLIVKLWLRVVADEKLLATTTLEDRVKTQAQKIVLYTLGVNDEQLSSYQNMFIDPEIGKSLPSTPLILTGLPNVLWAKVTSRTAAGSDWDVAVQANYFLPNQNSVSAHFFLVKVAAHGAEIGVVSVSFMNGENKYFHTPFPLQGSLDKKSSLYKMIENFSGIYFTGGDATNYLSSSISSQGIKNTGFQKVEVLDEKTDSSMTSSSTEVTVWVLLTGKITSRTSINFQTWLHVKKSQSDTWTITEINPAIKVGS